MSAAALWTAAEAATATGGRAEGAWAATGVSIDSRTIAPGDLFVALAGPNFDGHDFVAGALAAGAAAAMVSRAPDGVGEGAPLLHVSDTLAGLEALAAAARSRAAARVIAVTGSVGKTGTKEALRLVLADQATAHASAGSHNNKWGVPLSLARLPRAADYGVFELGMNHAGELGPLSRQVRPHVAVVTNVEAVHLAFFASTDEIAEAKGEIFEGLEAGGVAVLHRDGPHFARLAAMATAAGAIRVIGFGSHPEAEARVVSHVLRPTHTSLTAEICGRPVKCKIGLPGRHWVSNCLAVLAAADAAGADLDRAALALARLSPLDGRGRRHRVDLSDGAFLVIDESYNASPVAVRAAIETLAAAEIGAGGRRIAVLGDMLELGDAAPKLHAGLATDLAAAGIDLVFTAGPNMAHLHEALPPGRRGGHAPTSADLVAGVCAVVGPGDVVLVKGSLGSRMRPIVDALLALGRSSARAVNG